MEGAGFWRHIKHKSNSVGATIVHQLRLRTADGALRTTTNADIDVERAAKMNQYQIAGITNENGKKWLRQNEIDNLFRENPRLISDIINARIDEKNDELRASGFAEMLVRANSVKLIELVVDCPQKFWDESNNATRASYFRDSIQFFNNWIGANNLILSVQHGDEKSKRVHLHLFYLPITADLRLSAKDIIGKNYDMHNRQVQFYNEVSSKYGMPMPDCCCREYSVPDVQKCSEYRRAM